MARLNLYGVIVIAVVGTLSCAAQAPPLRSMARAEPPPPATSVSLTGAQVPSTASPPSAEPLPPMPDETASMARAARWTDAEIVGALEAAQAGRDREAKAARVRSKSARVDRFAEDVLQQERETIHDESGFEHAIGSIGSDLRTQVEEARHAAAVASIDATGAGFDRDFMTAELRYERILMHLIEDEMLPSARAPQLRRFLESLRAKTARRISAAEEVESKLP